LLFTFTFVLFTLARCALRQHFLPALPPTRATAPSTIPHRGTGFCLAGVSSSGMGGRFGTYLVDVADLLPQRTLPPHTTTVPHTACHLYHTFAPPQPTFCRDGHNVAYALPRPAWRHYRHRLHHRTAGVTLLYHGLVQPVVAAVLLAILPTLRTGSAPQRGGLHFCAAALVLYQARYCGLRYTATVALLADLRRTT